MNPLQTIASEYADQGLSIVVARQREKVPLIEWRAYQYEAPSLFEREAMFSFEHNLNLGAVCGIGSHNLAVVDAESESAFADQLKRFNRAGLGETWVVKTFRGGHIYAQTNVAVKPFKGLGFEVRGQGQFILMPPSVHPSGTPYQFLSRPPSIAKVPIEALSWLQLEAAPQHKPLPRKARQLLSGDIYSHYASRSEAEQALVTTLVNAGFDFPETLGIFRSYSPDKFAEIERADPEAAMRWLRVCFEEARTWCATDSPARRFARAVQAKAESSPWPGRHGSTDRAVFLSHLNLAHRSGQPTYHASTRDIAEIAGVGRKTATRASRRLTKAGLLDLIQPATFAYANRYRLPEKTKLTPLPHIGLEGVGSTSSFLLPDAFRKGGLGRAAFEVLRALESGPMKAKEIEQKTGRHVQTVRKALLRLSDFGYAKKSRGRWSGKPLSEINLDELARIVGTIGARRKQKEKHRGERLRRKIATTFLQGGVA